ncbi:hypothetical protein ACTGXY_11425, partial [Streptococcus suis]
KLKYVYTIVGPTNTNSSSADSTVTKVVQKDQLLEIKYTRPINNGEVIKFAVWSEKILKMILSGTMQTKLVQLMQI